MCKEQDAIPRVAVQWRPEGHRKRGRPKTTWKRTVEAEAAAMGQSWGTLRMLAQDREQWKEFVAALIAHGKKGSKHPTVVKRTAEIHSYPYFRGDAETPIPRFMGYIWTGPKTIYVLLH
ncbi:hypothetical protein RRG08_023104 [Elysia crispata]|uniref:Uncharacterized protein n=1 Tax=Elysia crispata TaxID=231223 RepID=A0AAE0YB05_9GAST|nr:hypothetical protein RRG08_023104 [Elysia crispata]